MIFKEHVSQEQGWPDLLNYAHLIDEGVILNKDGAFLVTYQYRAPDIHSATAGELDAITAHFNRMATFLDDGWMLHIDTIRVPSVNYPEQGAFPDSVSFLIDEERRQHYEAEGSHYENLQFLTFVWKFPLPLVKTTRHWFVDGLDKTKDDHNLTHLYKTFTDRVERCVSLLSAELLFERLKSEDLLSYLNTCITGELLPIAVPPDGCFIDVVLGRRPLSGGYAPKVGKKQIHVLSIVGYLNEKTVPGLLEEMSTYPLIYRWSNRFIPLSELTAEREIKRYQKQWNNKVKGLWGVVKELIFGRPSKHQDNDALQMSAQTEEAVTANSNHTTRYGYWNSDLLLMDEDEEILTQASKALANYLEQSGFTCNAEDVNAMDAFLGTIPGHGSCNVRRIFASAMNVAHATPLHSLWAGRAFSAKGSLLPAQSPPVFYAATTGKTPFRFHLDVADVGHQMVVGPTGSGKSTYIGFLTAQFLRYRNANVHIFDKDYSHKGQTAALNGRHYDIGNAETLSFCPLANLSTASRKVRAEQFIETCVELQGIGLTPDIRSAIHTAMESLADESHANSRTLTVFRSLVQNDTVRSALQYYTLEGSFKLLDAANHDEDAHYLHTYEMNWLLAQKPEIYIPVLMVIFDQIEAQLEENKGVQPTLIVLEEAWLYISHPVFAKKLRDWLKTLRKKNARVIFATQSLADLYDPTTKTLNATTAVLMESCPTKVYLPNPDMGEEMRDLYRRMDLNERQIDIIKESTPKRDYYVVTSEGNRLIDLGFSDIKPMALEFIALSQEKTERLLICKETHRERWVDHWLRQNGFVDWATYWTEHETQKRAA